jgi:hypothetical protein
MNSQKKRASSSFEQVRCPLKRLREDGWHTKRRFFQLPPESIQNPNNQ